MLIMEIMSCYPQWINFKCPKCGSDEVANTEDTACHSCGNNGISCDKAWYSREARLKFHTTGKTI